MSTGQIVATVVYFVSVTGSLYFVIRRLTKVRWKRYPEGAALLVQHLALVGLGGEVVLVLTIGQGRWWQMPLYIVLLLVFTGAVWWLTYLQEVGLREAKRARADLTPSPEMDPSPVEDHQLG